MQLGVPESCHLTFLIGHPAGELAPFTAEGAEELVRGVGDGGEVEVEQGGDTT